MLGNIGAALSSLEGYFGWCSDGATISFGVVDAERLCESSGVALSSREGICVMLGTCRPSRLASMGVQITRVFSFLRVCFECWRFSRAKARGGGGDVYLRHQDSMLWFLCQQRFVSNPAPLFAAVLLHLRFYPGHHTAPEASEHNILAPMLYGQLATIPAHTRFRSPEALVLSSLTPLETIP